MLKRPKMHSFLKILKIGTHPCGYPKPSKNKNNSKYMNLARVRDTDTARNFNPLRTAVYRGACGSNGMYGGRTLAL